MLRRISRISNCSTASLCIVGEVKAIKGAALYQRLSRRAAYVVSVKVNDARMLFLGKRADTRPVLKA